MSQDRLLPDLSDACRGHEGADGEAGGRAARSPRSLTVAFNDMVSDGVARIFAQARQLFYERGFDATSMQDIADALGLHKSTLYHHISSKDELLEGRVARPWTGSRPVSTRCSDAPT